MFNIPLWRLHQWHDEEVKALLKEEGCMSEQGHIRVWRKDTNEKLREIGHTSLDFEKCECKSDEMSPEVLLEQNRLEHLLTKRENDDKERTC